MASLKKKKLTVLIITYVYVHIKFYLKKMMDSIITHGLQKLNQKVNIIIWIEKSN
jgi:hypothetical protein